jgi:hypothetical protein
MEVAEVPVAFTDVQATGINDPAGTLLMVVVWPPRVTTVSAPLPPTHNAAAAGDSGVESDGVTAAAFS